MPPPPMKPLRIAPAWARAFDEALAHAAAATEIERAETHRWIGREVAERRRHWFQGQGLGSTLVRWQDALLGFAIATLVLSVLAFASSILTTVFGCALGAILGMTSAGLWAAYLGAALRPSSRTSPRGERCPECNYILAGVPPAINPIAAEGVNTGPRVCPECACGWPLVPPPIPGEPIRYRRRVAPPG